VLGNQEDAQDVAQEAFLRLLAGDGQSARREQPPPDFPGRPQRRWRLQRAWRRRVKPMLGAEIMPILDETAPGAELEHQESLSRLRRALGDLRPEEQEVFLLRQNGELTYEQIAEVSNRPVGTVKTQMRAALHKLRKVLT
jgi:RNA polymerase sigma-70 factor (ECF subfamily)